MPTRREFCACCSKAAGLLALGAVGGLRRRQPDLALSNSSAVDLGVRHRSPAVTISVSVRRARSRTVGGMAITQTTLGTFLLTRTGASTRDRR